MIFYLLLGGVLFFHILDMTFTMLLITKIKKYHHNAEQVEQNYHKFFFKKYGIFKGGLISMIMISLPVMTISTIGLYFWSKTPGVTFLMGMNFAMAYQNYISWINYEDTRAKVTSR